MGRLTVESPAPLAAILDLGSASGSMPATLRTALFLQWKAGTSYGYRDEAGAIVAVLMIVPTIDGTAEICAQFAPAAARHVRELRRLAQLAFDEACESPGRRLVARVRTDVSRSNRLAAVFDLEPVGAEGNWTLYEWRQNWHRQSR